MAGLTSPARRSGSTIIRWAAAVLFSLTLAGCSLFFPGSSPGSGTETPPPGAAQVAAPDLVRIDMTSFANGWGVSENQVLITRDGASSWFDVTPAGVSSLGFAASSAFMGDTTAWVQVPDPENPESSTLYHTTDTGTTWASYPLPFGSAYLDFLDDQHGAALSVAGVGLGSSLVRIYRTENGGESWALVFENNPDLPADTPGVLPMAGIKTGISFQDENIGYVTGSVPADEFVYLYRTEDGGSTWNPVNLDLPAELTGSMLNFLPPVFFNPTQGKLAVSYQNPGGQGMLVFTTNNGGQSWMATTPIPISGPVDFVNMQFGVVSDGNVFYATQDGGQIWKQYAAGIRLGESLAQLDFVVPGSGYILSITADGARQIYRTDDGGTNMRSVP
ncbi:MAG: hypothetical protein ACK2UW_15460 [Anaerolineales bacterium]